MNRTSFSRLRLAALAAAVLAVVAGQAQAQNAVIRGTVVSDAGQPIQGALASIPDLNVSGFTNDAGRYVVTVAGGRVRNQVVTLRVRAIGYRPGSRAITVSAGEQTMDFTLGTDINRLEEIVVTGAIEGTERMALAYDVPRVDMEDIPVPTMDPLRLLAGRVAGANVMSGSGRPGSNAAVILRGPTSIDASGRIQGPLVIVDGVVLPGGFLSDFNPADIESYEVAKGAASSSLYGARSGQGVIQITTRSGRRAAADAMTFNLRTEVGVSDIEGDFGLARNHPLIMDERNERFCVAVTGQAMCARTLDWVAEAARINNAPGDFALTPPGLALDPGPGSSGAMLRNNFQAKRWPGRIFNPVEQVVNPQILTTNNADVTGRFGNTQFFASGSYTGQSGAIRFLEGYKRYTGRLNLDQRIGDAWSVALRSFYSRSTQDGLNQETGGGAFFRLTRVPAIVNILQRDALGRLYVRPNLQRSGEQNENPLQSLQNIDDQGVTDRFVGGLTLRYEPASWVSAEGNFSYDYRSFTRSQFVNKGFRATTSFFSSFLSIGSVFDSHSGSQAFNTGLSVVLRRNLGRNLATRWNLRYSYDQQDENARSGSGNTLAAVGVSTLDNATAGFSIGSFEVSQRLIGLSAGGNLVYGERYIVDGVVRRDGSSLFGSDNRWATFARGSLAWRMSREPWWFAPNFLNEFKVRVSRGGAGGRPNFSAQYETFAVGAGGISFGNLGNRDLRPEHTIETEAGLDVEILRRIAINATYARSQTRDQILLVPTPVEKGFGQQWRNAGTLENRTWELSVNVPIVSRRDLSWSVRFNYDRPRTVITQLDVPPFQFGGVTQATGQIFRAQEGERYGTFYGKRFLRSCSELPSAFQSQCGGGGSQFQINNDGYLVWTGGYGLGEGITRNLWTTRLPGASAPWGVAVNWGMLIVLRDTACVAAPRADCTAQQVPLGNALPEWNFSISQNFQWRRLTVSALLQASMGREVWNQGRHWSYLDFLSRDVDQEGRSVEEAKPIGYYFRSAPPDHPNGVGGLYDILAPNNHFVEDASFAKLRELMVSFHLGRVGASGDWTVSVIGRNLFTITDYRGFDPEVGQSGGLGTSPIVTAVDAFTFPNTRSVTFSVSSRF